MLNAPELQDGLSPSIMVDVTDQHARFEDYPHDRNYLVRESGPSEQDTEILRDKGRGRQDSTRSVSSAFSVSSSQRTDTAGTFHPDTLFRHL